MTFLRLAVIGDPVAHSKSPEFQRGYLAAAGIDGSYEAVRVPSGEGAAAIAALRERGYNGLNVTTPLKEEAYARADRRDAAAEAAQAVNTLLLRPDRIEGYNTDGDAALGALADAGLPRVTGARVLVLGAGPTARAAIAALVCSKADVFIWNRTRWRAEEAAALLGASVWGVGTLVDAAVAALPPDATLEPPVRDALLATPIVVDANYGSRATLGNALGRSDVRDGLAMLRAGARASFELFRSLR